MAIDLSFFDKFNLFSCRKRYVERYVYLHYPLKFNNLDCGIKQEKIKKTHAVFVQKNTLRLILKTHRRGSRVTVNSAWNLLKTLTK